MRRVAVALVLVSSMTPATTRMAHAADPRRPTTQGAVQWPEQEAAVPLAVRSPAAGARRNDAPAANRVPRPSRPGEAPVTVAVGLSPEAPGSKQERALLDRLMRSARASSAPATHVRRLRPGAGEPRRICRERRDDLVIMIGYLPDREEPVVLAHDCKLDMPLDIRGIAAVDEPALVAALWNEHDELVRAGHRERRRLMRIGPKARAGIVAGVALVVVGVAVGLLVANALRDEKVVLTVSP